MRLDNTKETFFMDNEEFDVVKSDPLTEVCGHQDFVKKNSGKEGGKKQKYLKHFNDPLTQSHKKILVDILALMS
jgi:hypothetical protein